MVVLHVSNGGGKEGQVGKQDTSSSKSQVGAWRLSKTKEQTKQKKTHARACEKVENPVKDTNRGKWRSYHMAQEKTELWEVAGR